MIKCPFCQFENESGATFCEQCKSDMETEVGQVPSMGIGAAEAPMAFLVDEFSTHENDADSAAKDNSPFQFLGTVAPEPALAPPYALPEAMASAPGRAEVPPGLASFSETKADETDSGLLPAHARPRLLVVRGQKVNVEYPLFPGNNFIGRTDDKPVDIDLEEQEPPDRIWSSRQHAIVTLDRNQLVIEDLNSSNGTFVNRVKIYPGQRKQLKMDDLIQIGTVHLKVQM